MAVSASSRPQSPCEGGCSDITRPTFYCVDCLSHYCDFCWPEQGPHKPGKISPTTKRPHEKTNRDIWTKVQAILEPPEGEDLIKALHREDENTKWFGVTKDSKYGTLFEDTGRYAELMADSRPLSGASRIPQLVSFIGDTSAGKSTLIKMLIGRGEQEIGPTADSFPSPVVGAASHDQIATSEGVHLYSDPETYRTSLPILYADCEGLNAGEDTPIAAKSRAHKESSRIRRNLEGVSRRVHWANENPEQSRRDFAVRNLYPRVLYTFSDVIVFVLKNPRTFHITLQLLLEWADDCLEKSLNQPILPHAIIVLNAVDVGNDEDRWDVREATRSLMGDSQHLINTDAKFRRFANLWRLRGWRILNTEDLLRCYYDSISAVRIPVKTPSTYIFIRDQVAKLRATIGIACDQAYEKKTITRMVSNADELDQYLQAGFDHFVRNLDQPFNFSKVAMKHKPIPQDIGDHILTLASAVQEKMKQPGEKLFGGLSKIVASCIMFDIVRQSRKGPVDELFKNHYAMLCKAALNEFCRTNWPCEYQDRKGRICQNFKSTHSKGHQDQKGRVIGGGPYKSAFSADKFNDRWVQILRENLHEFSARLSHANLRSDGKLSELTHAISLHQRNMTDFFGHLRYGEHYYSLATCLCCLTEVPQHPLPCGHVLCTPCVKDFGYAREEFLVSLDRCPLHPEDGSEENEWLVRFKPSFAGVRVLSLDGGGVRGIVELLVLRAIENSISGASQDSRIPIQNFFDLIVGTSTGGIIALGLAAKRWSISFCIQTFLGLCQRAFTQREFHDIPLLHQAATLNHGSKWRTQPFHDALQSAFGKDEVLYGGKHENAAGYAIKVGATSTSSTGQQALLLANYNRQEDRHCEYKIDFASTAENSLKVWEVAAATSAAPSFFKPFRSITNESTYLDGALFHNNPVKVANSERKILWPDVAEKHPDIFLSIGTGQNLRKMEVELKHSVESLASSKASKKTSKIFQLEMNKSKKRHRVWRGIKDFFGVLINRFDNILDAEATWRAFCDEAVGASWASEDSTRYIRVNVDLRMDPPPLDAKDRLADIQAIVDRQLQTPSYESKINDIADRLVASAFYFVKAGKAKRQHSGDYMIIGKICCRFDNGSDEIRTLGNFFRRQQDAEFQPSFIIKVRRGSSEEHNVLISAKVIEDMRSHAHFQVPEQEMLIPKDSTPILIMLRLQVSPKHRKEDYLISGFPRVFVGEDEANELMLERRNTAIQKQRLGAIRVRTGTESLSSDIAIPYVSDSGSSGEEKKGDDDTEDHASLYKEANLTRALWESELPERSAAETVTALFDFEAQAQDELEFKKGNVIEVVQRTQKTDEWWMGRLNGKEGWFPGNYVEPS